VRYWKPKPLLAKPLVGIAVASFLNGEDKERRVASLCGLLHAFCAQTYTNWQVLVTHDGPLVGELSPYLVELLKDKRISFIATEERKQQFGHPHRQAAIESLVKKGAEWVGLTNDDNYYMPVYFEWLLTIAQEKKADFVYCDSVHSHKQWKPLTGEIRRGRIDLGGFLANKGLLAKVKFDKFTFAGDWDFIYRLRLATKRVAKAHGTLFVHN